MIVHFDSSNSITANTSSQVDSKADDGRHHAWLFELERALLADSTKKRVNNTIPDESNPQDDTADTGQSTFQSDVENEKKQLNLPSKNQSITSSGDQNETSNERHRAVSNTVQLGDVREEASSISKTTSSSSSTNDFPRLLLIPKKETVPTAHAINEAYGVSLQAVVSSQDPTTEAFNQNQFSPILTRSVSSMKNVDFGSSVGAQYFADSDSNSTNSAEESTRSHNGDKTDSTTTQSEEPFLRRQLHLFKGDDGIQAWIRDVDVDESDVLSIANALSNELSQSGEKLVAVTVNGKKIGNGVPPERREDVTENVVLSEFSTENETLSVHLNPKISTYTRSI